LQLTEDFSELFVAKDKQKLVGNFNTLLSKIGQKFNLVYVTDENDKCHKVAAFVSPAYPDNIFFCHNMWNRDSIHWEHVLVHEMSHRYIATEDVLLAVMGTDKKEVYAYGVKGCRLILLAYTESEQALENADSYACLWDYLHKQVVSFNFFESFDNINIGNTRRRKRLPWNKKF